MQDSGNLHLLVHTLTKHEKIFFRNQSKRWGDEKDYLNLFDYLLSKDSVNDKMIRSHFEGESFLKRLPAVKNYLLNKILESLILMDRKRSMEGQIRERIDASVILHKKGLIRAAAKKLRKAAKLADATCNHRLQLEVIQVEKSLFGRYRVLNQEEIEDLFEREEEILGMIGCNNFFWRHSTITYASLSTQGHWMDQEAVAFFEELLEKEEMKSSDFTRGALAHARRSNLEGLVHQQLGHKEEFLAASRKVIEVFEEDELFRSSNLFLYAIGLDYLTIALISTAQYEEALKVNRQMEQLTISKAMPKENASTLNNLNFRILARQFTIYYQNREFAPALDLLPQIEALLEEGPEVEQAGQLELYFQVAGLYFNTSNFEEGINWINKTLEKASDAGREDVFGYGMLLLVMSCYELDDKRKGRNKLKTSRRYFVTRDREEGMAKVLLDLLEALFKGDEDEQGLWLEAAEGLEKYQDQFPHNRSIELFDYRSWVNAHLNR